MAEKSTIFQSIQLGVESTPGTPVAANKKLLAVSMVPQARTEAIKFKALGNKYSSLVAINKEWTELAIDGMGTYNEIIYLLSSLLYKPTPVQQGATAAYLWTFTPDTDGPDTAQAYTIEQGDATTAWRAAGAQVSGLTLTFSRNEVKVTGSGIAEQLEHGITLTATPTSLTPRPILPAHLTFKMADTQAGLAGASALTRGFSMEFSILNKAGLAWPVGQDPVALETDPAATAKLKLATDATGTALMTTMRAGSTKWFQIKATGALIASTYYYDLQIQFAAQIETPGDMADEGGIYAQEYGLEIVHDATWTKAYQILAQADMSAL